MMFQCLHVLQAPTKNVVSWGVPGRLDMSGECMRDPVPNVCPLTRLQTASCGKVEGGAERI